MKHGIGFDECSTSNGIDNTVFVKSSSLPQDSKFDVAKTKDRKPKSKQGAKPSNGSLAKRSKIYKDKPKGKLQGKPQGKPQSKPKGKPFHKGQTPKTRQSKQKTLSKRTSSPNIQCYYCMKYGHINMFCHIRREQLGLGTVVDANPKGPKLVWVPKTKN